MAPLSWCWECAEQTTSYRSGMHKGTRPTSLTDRCGMCGAFKWNLKLDWTSPGMRQHLTEMK